MADEGLDLTHTITQAQTGDRQAFAALYQHFADRLFRYLYARCADAALAEDLAAETWVHVAKSLPRFRFAKAPAETAFNAWLYTIARNLLIDTYRHRSWSNLSLSPTVVSREPPLDEQVLVQEEQQELHRALEQLPEDQREVLLLRFFGEHTTTEIMGIMGRGESAVKSLQFRALGALARLLGEQRRRH
ncbi:MAG: RNA polymerase sigma factor [Herpetosiphonaceae bacterium]|nr:RNA polymerase sigma factor [Herpetosiphonaceae bacterium]